MPNLKLRVIVSLCFLAITFPSLAQVTMEDFSGAWELLNIQRKLDSGEWVDGIILGNGEIWEGRYVGRIMYDNVGNMSAQVTTDPRGFFTGGDASELVNGYIAYYAKYEIDAERGVVTHHRLNHVNDGVSNISVDRFYEFDGDILTLTLAPEGTSRLVWGKLR